MTISIVRILPPEYQHSVIGISDDQASVLGEVQVIRSRSIAGATISRLGLASDNDGQIHEIVGVADRDHTPRG